MQDGSTFSIRRKPWPGPVGPSTDREAYIYDAMQPFLTSWRWDDPERRAAVRPLLNADQMAVWSIWNIDGQIDNGGISQAIFNSYGELCEDAVIGFAQLGLKEHAGILDAVLSCYERPISQDRLKRILMLERVAGMSGRDQDPDRFRDEKYRSELYKRCHDISDPAENAYWKIREGHPMEDTLSSAIDARRSSFFADVSGSPDGVR